MRKIKKENISILNESQKKVDLEIERSMYYLGKALYQFSLMKFNEKNSKKT